MKIDRNTFVISDTHFSHKNILVYEKQFRPFYTIQDMNQLITSNWNAVVGEDDAIIHLGDVCLGGREETKEIINNLNGYKILILGNHDRRTKTAWKSIGFQEVYDKLELIIENRKILFTHRPELSPDSFNLNIHGHVHSKNLDSPKHFNASVENLGFTPLSLSSIIK